MEEAPVFFLPEEYQKQSTAHIPVDEIEGHAATV